MKTIPCTVTTVGTFRDPEVLCQYLFPFPESCPKKLKSPTTNKEKDPNMHVTQDMTVRETNQEDTRREYFLSELRQIYHDLDDKLHKKFGLTDDSRPRNAREVVERIKKGEFTFAHDDTDDEGIDNEYYHPWEFIRWTKTKKDRAGYKEAFNRLMEELTRSQRLIWAETDASKFPEILDKFQKSKLH